MKTLRIKLYYLIFMGIKFEKGLLVNLKMLINPFSFQVMLQNEMTFTFFIITGRLNNSIQTCKLSPLSN